MKCDDTEVSKSLSLLNRWSPRNDIMSYTFSSIIDTEKWHVVQIPQMSLLLQGLILLFGLSIIVDLLWNNLLNYFRHTWSTNMYANSVQFMILSIVSRFHHKNLFGIWTTNYVAALKIAAKSRKACSLGIAFPEKIKCLHSPYIRRRNLWNLVIV